MVGDALQAWQHAEDMKKRIVSNAMCSWAEAVALSAGEDIDFDRSSCSQATVQTFEQLRKVTWTPHQLATLSYVSDSVPPPGFGSGGAC